MGGDRGNRAKPPGLGEFLFNEITSALRDIRQKVVEEGWFGRTVTPTHPGKDKSQGGHAVYDIDHHKTEFKLELNRTRTSIHMDRRPSFEEQWAPRDRAKETPEIEKDRAPDLDR